MKRFNIAVVWRRLNRRSERSEPGPNTTPPRPRRHKTYAVGAFAAGGRVIENVAALLIEEPGPAPSR